MASPDRAHGPRDPADKPLDRLGLLYAAAVAATLAAHLVSGPTGPTAPPPAYERAPSR